MIEDLNPLATAECDICGGFITLYIGDLTGENWYHDRSGKLYCPMTKLATPKMSTYRRTHKE